MPNPKQDFRKDMNRILEVFYLKKGTINIIKAIRDLHVPLDIGNIDMICTSLERDGYVELLHGYSQNPVGNITGQGRIFWEQGGYRDARSRLDRMTDWFKNHKVTSVIILIFTFVSATVGLVVAFKEIIEWTSRVK